MNSKMLNLGCGNVWHPDWLNLDQYPSPPDVGAIDLRKPFPFPDNQFEVVYHSHVLEHFDRAKAQQFLSQCFRVLQSGGTLRVVLPNLEEIAREYVKCLDDLSQNKPGAAERQDWITIELIDQLVRHKSGGEMMDYWKQDPIPALAYMNSRIGESKGAAVVERILTSNRKKLSENLKIKITEKIRYKAQRIQNFIKQRVHENYPVIEVGTFRLSGEVHQWMYDQYSLGRLLQSIGFTNIKKVAAHESRISGFDHYHLDTLPDGKIRKPDSLFVEASKAITKAS